MAINMKLLPIHLHFFLLHAGIAPLVPYLSTYARQLGFSSSAVGLIYTFKLFGVIAFDQKVIAFIAADRFWKVKPMFIVSLLGAIVSFSAIYVIPQNESKETVNLDCYQNITVLRSCYKTAESIDQCKIDFLGSQISSANCNMKIDMSPKMWQTVCENWHIPQYCYRDTNSFNYVSEISNVTMGNDNCAYISVSFVTLDDYNYKPHCRIGDGHVDTNGPCKLRCTNQKLFEALKDKKANMTCLYNNLSYRLCSDTPIPFRKLKSSSQLGHCWVSCEIDEPWRHMEICKRWGADAAQSCQTKTTNGEHFPPSLSFVGKIELASTKTKHDCVNLRLLQIEHDGSSYYPNCKSKAQYQMESTPFHISSAIKCDNVVVNEVIQAASKSQNEATTQYTTIQFWLFFMFMVISWICLTVVATFADTVVFDLLVDKTALYSKQRLCSSVGWGVISLSTGILIDLFSDGAYKNYTIAFILMFIFLLGDVVLIRFLNARTHITTQMSMSIVADVDFLMSSLPTVVYMLWMLAMGLCNGLLRQFLSWHLEDIAATCDGLEYIKTLQGLVIAIQTFLGDIPLFFVSGYILKKVGHVNMMTFVSFAFGLRFILYSYLTKAWWVLPIELFEGLTIGMFYPTIMSYANAAPAYSTGTETITTNQFLLGNTFLVVGSSLGSLISGCLYEFYGGRNTFQWFGIGSMVIGVIHVVARCEISRNPAYAGFTQVNQEENSRRPPES